TYFWQNATRGFLSMTTKTVRKIVRIDETKCNGCGLCIPNCAEGALRIINGKARLSADNLCDGLGACLGTCPMDAITLEERPADQFDEHAIQPHLHPHQPLPTTPHSSILSSPLAHSSCPGSRPRLLHLRQDTSPSTPSNSTPTRSSRLAQWPVQLALLPATGPMWDNAHLLIAADCVPFAYPDFHETLLAGRTLAIACPKLDNVQPYVEKLALIFAHNTIQSITVAHMEVPCCSGIVRVVQLALAQSARTDIPLHDLTIFIDGTLRTQT
ncbi:MAG TPA: 4Fe-4S binding protein, partial [Tepidisphaeraceae bacterium]|nr:4Fe-4S binding protein [Tepidisphaeraceae bacterium]